MECKICNRKFANGKAMGGHMRSHFALLPLPSKARDLNVPLTDTSSSILSYDERENSGDKSPLARMKCKSAIGMKEDEDDQEVTTKGIHQKPIPEAPLMMDEDVAMCLVMLSRDVWRNADESGVRDKINYQCDMCNKVFKSAQGLGSHMSNHHHQKKLKKSSDGVFKNLENHECRFCDKVFGSAQALGGHKKVHHLKLNSSSSLTEDRFFIDLNSPPEIENEDEELDSY